jgi:2-polyprenyl-3-methyl-5-hydroxy-6-metoxy-1,4-benzoquinol methylase
MPTIPKIEVPGVEITCFLDESVPVPSLQYPVDVEARGAHLKSAFRYAIDQAYDYVIQLSGSIGESPDSLIEVLRNCQTEPAVDCVLMSDRDRSISRHIRDLVFSKLQSFLTGARLTNWYPTARIYRTSVLTRIVFELNTDESHFETEVIQQLLYVHATIREMIYSGGSSCNTLSDSWSGRWNALKTGVKYRLQTVNLFYDFRYHPELVLPDSGPVAAHLEYHQKFQSDSPHAFVVQDPRLIRPGSRVLDIGCARGYVAEHLVKEKGCKVTGVDLLPEDQMTGKTFDYHRVDLEKEVPKLLALLESDSYDYILLLDVLEHLPCPELFLLELHRHKAAQNAIFVLSTGNVAFFVVRLMLFLGYFNYGQKGILDITHKRLFSVRTFKNLLDQTGFVKHQRVCFPLPYQEVGFSAGLSTFSETVHRWFLRIRPSLFAYQVLYVCSSTRRQAHKPATELPEAGFVNHRRPTTPQTARLS